MDRTITASCSFDIQIAQEMVDAFVVSTGVSCLLINSDGQELYCRESEHQLCSMLRDIVGDQICEKIHLESAFNSERFGGRYIYFCPMGMGWFASPIILEGKIAGALAAGPVMVMDKEDHYASTPILQSIRSPKTDAQIDTILKRFPRREPADLSHMSVLLLSIALYIGGERRSLLEHQQTQSQYRDIGEYIKKLKTDGVDYAYPMEKEHGLLQAITEGNRSEAQKLLNELLGHIHFFTGWDFSATRTRALELLALVSRAAVEAGVDTEHILSLNQKFLKESDYLRTTAELTAWLNRIIEKYTSLVSDIADAKHKGNIHGAINYMKRNITEKLTLEDVAKQAGFSPTYFSKVFKEEMGATFSNYLCELRIKHSKALLLSGELSVGDVCTSTGFEDQSYFIKVFKKHTGVTPGKFRKQQGRLDPQKERCT